MGASAVPVFGIYRVTFRLRTYPYSKRLEIFGSSLEFKHQAIAMPSIDFYSMLQDEQPHV